MIQVRTLQPTDLEQLHACFLAAFEGYFVPMNMSYEQFAHRFVHKLLLNYALSAGAFDGHHMVGFILTSTYEFQGEVTAYNAGTGVVPNYRGQGLTVKMYAHLFDHFKAAGIGQCALEVITANKGAVRSYEKSGLNIAARYQCYQLPVDRPLNAPYANSSLQLTKAAQPNWPAYEALWQVQPCYSSLPGILTREGATLHIVEAHMNNQLAGYAAFYPDNGRIEHLAVAQACLQQGVGSALLHYMQQHNRVASMSVLNVQDTATATCTFFERRGFINHLNQYLMLKPMA